MRPFAVIRSTPHPMRPHLGGNVEPGCPRRISFFAMRIECMPSVKNALADLCGRIANKNSLEHGGIGRPKAKTSPHPPSLCLCDVCYPSGELHGAGKGPAVMLIPRAVPAPQGQRVHCTSRVFHVVQSVGKGCAKVGCFHQHRLRWAQAPYHDAMSPMGVSRCRSTTAGRAVPCGPTGAEAGAGPGSPARRQAKASGARSRLCQSREKRAWSGVHRASMAIAKAFAVTRRRRRLLGGTRPARRSS
jgi:hypothetical protein